MEKTNYKSIPTLFSSFPTIRFCLCLLFTRCLQYDANLLPNGCSLVSTGCCMVPECRDPNGVTFDPVANPSPGMIPVVATRPGKLTGVRPAVLPEEGGIVTGSRSRSPLSTGNTIFLFLLLLLWLILIPGIFYHCILQCPCPYNLPQNYGIIKKFGYFLYLRLIKRSLCKCS